ESLTTFLSVRVPLGLALTASGLFLVLTWTLIAPNPIGPSGSPPAEVRSLTSTRGESPQPLAKTGNPSTITISGVVEDIRTSRLGELETSVVTVKDLAGNTYRILTVGNSLLRKGDMIQATANFSRTSRSADTKSYEGAGTVVRLSGSR